jgi:hypothetical protein
MDKPQKNASGRKTTPVPTLKAINLTWRPKIDHNIYAVDRGLGLLGPKKPEQLMSVTTLKLTFDSVPPVPPL